MAARGTDAGGTGRERRAASTRRVGGMPPAARARRVIMLATAGVLVVVAAVATWAALAQGRVPPAARDSSSPAASPGSGAAPPGRSTAAAVPAAAAASDLDRAADAVGFRIISEANIGIVETLPADTTLLPPSRSLLPVGSLAPGFSLRTPGGETVRLSDLRGKTVLLEIFATWCPHCQAEAPHLLSLWNSLPKDRFAFVSINGDSEDAASVHAFTRAFGLPWPALLDPGDVPGSFNGQGSIGPVSRSYGLALFPTFYVIDPRGRIAWRADREQPDARILQELYRAAGE